MLAPAQAVGNAAVQAGGPSDGGTAEAARLRETAQAIASSQENGAAGAPVQAESAKAVQPTPISAKAVKVDLDSDRGVEDGVVEYPITGPDKFAKTIADAKRFVYEQEQREAAGEAMDKASGARESRTERGDAMAAKEIQAERHEAAVEFAARPPAVSGAGDSAVAQADAALEAEMAEEAVDEAMDKAAETRREES